MYVQVTVFVSDSERGNAWNVASDMAREVNGILTSYDVSTPDNQFWSFGGDRIDQTEKV